MTKPERKPLAERLAPHRGLPGISDEKRILKTIDKFMDTPIKSLLGDETPAEYDKLTVGSWMETIIQLLPTLEDNDARLKLYSDHTRLFFDRLKCSHLPEVERLLDINYKCMMKMYDQMIAAADNIDDESFDDEDSEEESEELPLLDEDFDGGDIRVNSEDSWGDNIFPSSDFDHLFTLVYNPEDNPSCQIICGKPGFAYRDTLSKLLNLCYNSDTKLRTVINTTFSTKPYHPVSPLGDYLAGRQCNLILTYMGFFKPIFDIRNMKGEAYE